LHGRISLAYTSKALLTCKLLVLLSELGEGQFPPLPPWLRVCLHAYLYTSKSHSSTWSTCFV